MRYWVGDGEPDPDIPWPRNWEVCGVPSFDPISITPGPKRHGTTTLAWPMFGTVDPLRSLADVCSFLEMMSPPALEAWYALPDRFLGLSCSDLEMDLAEMNKKGFFIPAELIHRVRKLRLRLQVSFHPPGIRLNLSY